MWRRTWLMCVHCMICSMLGAVMGVPVLAKEPRDPFVDPRTIPHTDDVKPKLMGTLMDAQKPLAIIGESVVVVGDIVDGWTVIDIHADRVVIERGQQRQTLTFGQLLPTQ